MELECGWGNSGLEMEEATYWGGLQIFAKRRQLGLTEPPDPVYRRFGDVEKKISRSVVAIAVLALPFGNTCLDGNPAGYGSGHGCLHCLNYKYYIGPRAPFGCDAGHRNRDFKIRYSRVEVTSVRRARPLA